MFKNAAMALGLVALLLLSGCAAASQVENQAYVVILGLDRCEDDQLEITVQAPKIKGEGSEGKEQSDFMLISVRGSSFTEALELLSIASPRRVNLTQVKMVVVSEALAQEDRFQMILQELSETYTLFSTSYFAVCEGSTRGFVQNQEPIFSPGISSSLTALLEYHSGHGFVPVSTFADVLYRTNSCYSDPAAILAGPLGDSFEDKNRVNDAPPHLLPSEIPAASESNNEYVGCALFRGGRMVGKMDASETVMRNLISGSTKEIVAVLQEESARLVPCARGKIEVEYERDPVQITYRQSFRAYPLTSIRSMDAIEKWLGQELLHTFQKCQNMGVEPFGIAETIAGRFQDFSAWQGYDWHSRFAKAEFHMEIDVEIGNQ